MFSQWDPLSLASMSFHPVFTIGLAPLTFCYSEMFLAFPPWNQPFLYAALVPFSGEWQLDTNIWVWGVLIATGVLLLVSAPRTELEFMCIQVHTDTLIPMLHCRNHLNFVPVFVTPLSPYHQYICLFYSSYVTHLLTLCPAAPMFHMDYLLIWLHLWSQDEDAAATLATSSYTY